MHCCAPISIGRGRYRRMSWRHVSRLRGVASTATPPSGWKDLENHGLSTGRGACSVCCAHPLCESKTSFAQVTEVRRYADIGSVNPNNRTAEHLRRVIHRRVTHYQQAEIGFRQESSSAEISNAGHLRQRNRKKFAGAMDGTPAINGESCDRAGDIRRPVATAYVCRRIARCSLSGLYYCFLFDPAKLTEEYVDEIFNLVSRNAGQSDSQTRIEQRENTRGC